MADTGNADIKKLTFERAIEELETIVQAARGGQGAARGIGGDL